MTPLRTLALLGVFLTSLWGCSSPYRGDPKMIEAMTLGEFGEARSHALQSASDDHEDRIYLLDRQKILWSTLAEGDVETASAVADYTYDQLRTQGVNAGKSVGRFLQGDENVQFWKGEPFEQAAGFTAVAIADGLRGHWGNMRAAALGSLFQIKDLSSVIEGERQANENAEALSDRELLVAAVERAEPSDEEDADAEQEAGEPDAFEDRLPLRASDYEPGYALAAIAERQLGLREEMVESLRQLTAVNPELRGLAGEIAAGRYNTVIVADYGLAPQKIRTGPDGAIAAYEARTPSGSEPLVVSSPFGEARYPVLTDYNRLATDLEWNNFEDVRLAKSYIGSGLVVAGAVVAAQAGSVEEALVGLGVAAVGAWMKSSAGADTRHCEALPQRTYLALLDLPANTDRVSLSIDGLSGARADLRGLSAPPEGEIRLVYTRLPVALTPRPIASTLLYANDATGALSSGPTLPYVLGGACVRSPSEAILAEYRLAGLPGWVNVADLERMYLEEGIGLLGPDGYPIGRHILEGGDALYTPAPGSQGFERLYYQEHPPYAPVGPTAQEILFDMNPAPASDVN